MTTIAHCFGIDQALLLKSVLEGCGVTAYVPDELTAQTAPTPLGPVPCLKRKIGSIRLDESSAMSFYLKGVKKRP